MLACGILKFKKISSFVHVAILLETDVLSVLCNFIEITLQHGCSPVNLLHIFRTYFLKNTSRRLLLKCRCGVAFHLSQCITRSNQASFRNQLFHYGGPYHTETSPLIFRANKQTGFCLIGTSIMKELYSLISSLFSVYIGTRK